MSFYHQEDCEGWKWKKYDVFRPSISAKEVDVLWVSYSNKPDELEKEDDK